MARLLLPFFAACVLAPLATDAQVSYATRRPMFVLFGDSITEFGFNGPSGWAAQLAALYSRKADIINRGLSGWNSRWAAYALPDTLAELRPASNIGSPGQFPFNPRVQLVTVWFGANDAVLPNGKDGRLSVPLDEYKAGIGTLVQQAKDAGVPNILVITPPPVDEDAHAKDFKIPSSDRTNEQLAKYAAAAKAAAEAKGVPCLDMFSLMRQLPADKLSGLLYDGVHPNAEGQTFIFNAVKTALESWDSVKGLSANSLPYQWPPWNMVDPQKPAATFKQLYDKKLVTVN